MLGVVYLVFGWGPATWTAVGTLALAAATLIVATVAVFAEPLRRRLSRTRVTAELNGRPPDLHQIALTNRFTGAPAGSAMYSRFRIKNEGEVAAESVEVFVSEVRSAAGVVPTFLPLSLTWSHYEPPSSTTRIPAGMYRHCDLGRFVEHDGRTIFLMSTIVQPNAVAGGAPPNFLSEGDYEIDTTVGGDNVRLWSATWRLSFDGRWSDDERLMLKRIKVGRVR